MTWNVFYGTGKTATQYSDNIPWYSLNPMCYVLSISLSALYVLYDQMDHRIETICWNDDCALYKSDVFVCVLLFVMSVSAWDLVCVCVCDWQGISIAFYFSSETSRTEGITRPHFICILNDDQTNHGENRNSFLKHLYERRTHTHAHIHSDILRSLCNCALSFEARQDLRLYSIPQY